MSQNEITWIKCSLCGIKTHSGALVKGKCRECQKIGLKKPVPPVEKKPVPIPLPEPRRLIYDEDTEAGKLERYLHSKNIQAIGDMMMMWNRYKWEEKMEKGLLRQHDMLPMERAIRTLFVKQMSFLQVDEFHKLESNYFGGLAIFILDLPLIQKKIGKRLDRGPLKTTFAELEVVREFNNDHRPIYEENFEGHRIPPFFMYDNTFDGIEYHHAWDQSVWKAELNFRPAGKQSLADVVGKL